MRKALLALLFLMTVAPGCCVLALEHHPFKIVDAAGADSAIRAPADSGCKNS